eukprot:1384708-Rhodomonas_salina.2
MRACLQLPALDTAISALSALPLDCREALATKFPGLDVGYDAAMCSRSLCMQVETDRAVFIPVDHDPCQHQTGPFKGGGMFNLNLNISILPPKKLHLKRLRLPS